MKKITQASIALVVALTATISQVNAAGKIQGADVKTLTEVGGVASRLIGTDKIYDSANSQQLSASISNGQLGGDASGGGGINLLKNAGFEFGAITNGWTISGGSSAIVSSGANLLIGKQTASWQASAIGQTFKSDAKAVQGLAGGSCNAQLYYLYSGTSGDYKFQVYDGSNQLLNEASLPANSVSSVPVNVPFMCPSSSTQTIYVQLISLVASPGFIYFDNVHGGSLSLTAAPRPASVFVGEAHIAVASGCGWTRSTTSEGVFGATANCPGPTVTLNPGPGVIQTTDTNLPEFTVVGLPAGVCTVKMSGQVHNNSSNQWSSVGISDGTDNRGFVSLFSSAASSPAAPFTSVASFTTTEGQTKTFKLIASSTGGMVNINNDSASNRLNFSISCTRQAEQTLNAVQLAPKPSYGAVQFPGGLSGNTSAATTSATFGVVNNTGYASPSVFGRSAASGTSGNFAAVFSEVPAGNYKVKTNARITNTNNVGAGDCELQLYDVTNARQLALMNSANGAAYNSGGVLEAVFNQSAYMPTMEVQVRIRSIGGVSCNTGSSNGGAQLLYISLEPLDQSMPQPVIPGSFYVPGNSASVHAKFFARVSTVCSASPCTIEEQSGTISQIIRLGSGQYEVLVPSGTCSSKLACFWTATNSSTDRAVQVAANYIPTATAAGALFQTRTFTALDAAFDVECSCKR